MRIEDWRKEFAGQTVAPEGEEGCEVPAKPAPSGNMISDPDKGQDIWLFGYCLYYVLLRPNTKPKAQRVRELGVCTAEGDKGREKQSPPGTDKPGGLSRRPRAIGDSLWKS